LTKGEKKVHLKIDRGSKLTLKDVLRKIKDIQTANPDLDVFFDGDEYAICSRPIKKETTVAHPGSRKIK
jgi:hypothetical protein